MRRRSPETLATTLTRSYLSSVAATVLLSLPALSQDPGRRVVLRIDGAAGALQLFVSAIDVDGDGGDDIAVSNQQSETGAVLLSDGEGDFDPGGSFSLGFGAREAHAGDLDGDGFVDLIHRNQNSTRDHDLSIVYGAAAGRFRTAMTQITVRPTFLAVADFDADGRSDIVVAAHRSNPRAGPTWLDNEFQILFGARDRQFARPDPEAVPLDATGAYEAGDFNGDGAADFAIWGASHDGPHLLIYEGRG